MGYISKELLIKAYKTLSTLTDDHKQGQTQYVSIIRHFVALDMFYYAHLEDCNLDSRDNRNEFVVYVKNIVGLIGDYYIVNFYDAIKPLQDCGVGSNFYSAGVVNNSKQNTTIEYDYPTRGQNPLFKVKANVLIRNVDYYKNINFYLHSKELKSAFIIWLLRNENLESLDWNTVNKSLNYLVTDEMVDSIAPDEDSFNDYVQGYSITNTKPNIEVEDFLSLFNMPNTNKKVTFHIFGTLILSNFHQQLLTALRTKPFALLAGISGTGKSRIVRELAKACWPKDSEERTAHKPSNFEMVQVRPNWHDSSELLGYVSRINGKPEFVTGDFLKFVVRAWENLDMPHFLCLDEMNLAPVEQYFAEYLSVIESRKLENDIIVTDALLKVDKTGKDKDDELTWYEEMVDSLLVDCPDDKIFALRQQFLEKGITIPQNLFVVGTVNMDETTFSFSRKVLDRAMTIEMNEVDLKGGLEADAENEFGEIGGSIIPQVVEGKDVYAGNKELCDNVIEYLEQVNEALDKTPFKIAYRTRNEFLVYAVCRGEVNLISALDEMTSMKILSRIEGDIDRTKEPLDLLEKIVNEKIVAKLPKDKDGNAVGKSISAAKIEEMKVKLNRSSYTSFWS